MKKILLGLISLITVFTLMACNKNNKEEADYKADVIVIGAGGAGMSSAIEVANAGQSVIIFEKMPITGGNTTYATGGINAALTPQQKELCDSGINTYCDSLDTFINDIMVGGGELNERDLVTKMATDSADAIDFLENTLDADLESVKALGGHSVQRTHFPSDGSPVGGEIVRALNDGLADESRSDNIELVTNAEVKSVTVSDDGKVTGVIVEIEDKEYVAESSAVVIAAGGFGNNEDMIVKNDPTKEGFISTNHPGATGDGITIAEEIGVDLVHMDQIQIHPTVNLEHGKMITEGVRGDGAFLVNAEGERFINEMDTRDVVSAAILEQTGAYAYLVYSQEIRDSRLVTHQGYENQGMVTEGASDGIEALSTKLGMTDHSNIVASLAEINTCIASADFSSNDCRGRNDVNLAASTSYTNDQNWKAIKIAPATHHTMGGIKINTEAEAINGNGEAIDGLYAAGEVTGGIHGNNRLGGNALTDIIVFGREAGINASVYAKNEGSIDIEVPEIELDCNPASIYKNGEHEVTGKSTYNNQDIVLKVIVSGNRIQSITVVDSGGQTDSIFIPAFDSIKESFMCGIEGNDLDIISGASGSSTGIIEALKKVPTI